jgi:hypothetical protein
MADEINIKRYSRYGEGFALMPWAEHFREGRMPNFPDSWIAVLPVIVAHANENREAWPARICALAQVSRTTLQSAISGLVEKKWIARFSRKTGKNTHNVYRLIYGDGFDSRHWIALHHDLIFSGVWGKMRPSDRKVYLMLRAFAWRGGHAISDGFIGDSPEDYIEEEQAGIFYDSNFLPAHIYDPAEFQKLSGMNGRTFRDSFSWLLVNMLVIRTGEGDDMEDGFLMPFRPKRHAPDIMQKVAEAELDPGFVKQSPGSKRALTYALRRQRLIKAGLALHRRDMLEVQSTDKRQ